MLNMKYRPRIYYSDAQKALMWDRWQKGDSMHAIGGSTAVEPDFPASNLNEQYTPPPYAPVFSINSGLNDAWFNPVTDGQGFFITVFPELGFVSLAWFTYDTMQPAEDASANLRDPGHRWLTALGPIEGNQSVMGVSIASGGLFDTPTDIERMNDGTIILTFENCSTGNVDYDFPSIGEKGNVPINRVASDNIELCRAMLAD
jgi:hypothetical protein